MSLLKKISSIVISAVLWIVILMAALFTFTTLATKDASSVGNIAGFTPLLVQSNSMSPTFDAGDLIMIHSCDAGELQVGDIITFHTIIENEFALNTHRIIEVNHMNDVTTFVTKGDNNDIADLRSITDGDIVGKYVFRSVVLGRILNFLTSSAGFLIVIVLPMLAFFIYQIYHLVMVGINLKKAIAMEEATEEYEKQEALKEEAERTKAELEKARAELEELRRLKKEENEENQ